MAYEHSGTLVAAVRCGSPGHRVTALRSGCVPRRAARAAWPPEPQEPQELPPGTQVPANESLSPGTPPALRPANLVQPRWAISRQSNEPWRLAAVDPVLPVLCILSHQPASAAPRTGSACAFVCSSSRTLPKRSTRLKRPQATRPCPRSAGPAHVGLRRRATIGRRRIPRRRRRGPPLRQVLWPPAPLTHLALSLVATSNPHSASPPTASIKAGRRAEPLTSLAALTQGFEAAGPWRLVDITTRSRGTLARMCLRRFDIQFELSAGPAACLQ